MSFDSLPNMLKRPSKSLNPFRTGQCLSTLALGTNKGEKSRLNPFRTGQCLSTTHLTKPSCSGRVLIPFVQGNVFRQDRLKIHILIAGCLNPFRTGQCLSTEIGGIEKFLELRGLNPFRTGQCLSTKKLGE